MLLLYLLTLPPPLPQAHISCPWGDVILSYVTVTDCANLTIEVHNVLMLIFEG